MKILLPLAAALCTLAACGSADSGPKTPEQAAAEMKNAVKMKPGKWQTTMQITKFDLPGAPPEAAAALKGTMGKAQTSEACLTKEEAERDPSELIRKGQGNGECTFENFNVSGGKLTGKMVCNKAGKGRMESTMDGTLDEEAMSMAMTSLVTDPSMPGGKAEMAMKMDMKRIGECN